MYLYTCIANCQAKHWLADERVTVSACSIEQIHTGYIVKVFFLKGYLAVITKLARMRLSRVLNEAQTTSHARCRGSGDCIPGIAIHSRLLYRDASKLVPLLPLTAHTLFRMKGRRQCFAHQYIYIHIHIHTIVLMQASWRVG